jgi:hypothetical protein
MVTRLPEWDHAKDLDLAAIPIGSRHIQRKILNLLSIINRVCEIRSWLELRLSRMVLAWFLITRNSFDRQHVPGIVSAKLARYLLRDAVLVYVLALQAGCLSLLNIIMQKLTKYSFFGALSQVNALLWLCREGDANDSGFISRTSTFFKNIFENANRFNDTSFDLRQKKWGLVLESKRNG